MPVESPYPSFEVPDIDIWTFLFENNNREYPDDKVIYIDSVTKRSYSYAQVKETAITFGTGLKALFSWRKGDVLALYTPNSIDTPAVTWGTHWAGGVLSPANPGYTAEELAYQLKDSGAKALITQLPFLTTARQAARMVGLGDDRIILIGDQRDPTGAIKHFTSIRNISGATRYRRTKVKEPKEDLAFLVYSSGTTGKPKGVMLTHGNIVANIMMIAVTEGTNVSWKGGQDGKGDKILAFLPFFHIYGLTCLIHLALHHGTTLVVMAKFDIESWCRIVQDFKITFCYVVPPVVLLLSKHPVGENYDLSSIRMMNSGAAPLTKEVVGAVYDRLKLKVKQGYGLSETSPTTHTQSWDDWDNHVGSVGKLLPLQTAKYMSPEEKEVPVGETGELWIRGPNVFKGYLNNPEGTRNALTDDGFFKTGDVGHQDAEGNFYITDRVKELIKYKGFQVAPAELEGLLTSNPAVNDAAVVGIYKEEQATEVPIAFIVPAQGIERTPEAAQKIISWLEKRVANHKRLRGGVKFVDEIPKAASGKILRRLLRTQVEQEMQALLAKDTVIKAKL
ncbi:acetyl-CoA synthetase-like protein [Patellaria atrata CBS 101060]|uniref:Acetyl-CoA synthetase-like protein n=1 Tax=Patellaria atrata CBS 101060 TaxID=1346257 RepID=A0A9P4VWM0_9PEZI|nr:acetyl-CoA synthetase-like protein [Patellaria atrata CBS 101060]